MRSRLVGLISVLALAAACEDPVDPTVEIVAGDYEATVFRLEEGSANTDVLAAGGLIDLTLHMDGTTSGRLLVPGGAEDGTDLDVGLAGEWSLERRNVTFDMSGDTFLRDMLFHADGRSLEGQATFGGGTVRLILSK